MIRAVALLFLVVVIALCPLLALSGCGTSFEDIEAAAARGDDDAKIRECQGEARAAFYVGKKSEAEALAVYSACVDRP